MGQEVQMRITLLGDGAVGKTSIRRRFLGQGFTTSHLQTIGADFAVMRQPIGDFTAVYQIWDLAGQQSFKSVRARFFKGTLGGVCVFDLTRRETFNHIASWIEELWRNNGKGVVPLILLGNKADLPNQEIKRKEVEKYVAALNNKTKKYGFKVHYLETSAKTGLNIDQAFELLGEQILNKLFE